jgi:hypothetical protein
LRHSTSKPLAVALALASFAASGGLSSARAEVTASAAASRFTPGLVSTADRGLSARAARRLGADVVRVEFGIGTPPAKMRRAIGALAKRGVRPLLLAGFHGRMPTAAEARNLAGWAAEFGRGGRFWRGRPAGGAAVRQIEFGNETSYRDQYGDSWFDRSYSDRAELYARRFAQAHAAIAATGRDVGLLAQADDGGTGSPNWVNHMFDAVPRLGRLVDGWTVHPYGPRSRWKPKIARLIAQTAANGARPTIPIDVTEFGISSDDGAPLTDNYGWPANQSFVQAASALSSTVAAMRADRRVGRRLRLFMVYAAHDLRRPRTTRDREAYFGALRHNLAPKGAYSAAVRRLFKRYF